MMDTGSKHPYALFFSKTVATKWKDTIVYNAFVYNAIAIICNYTLSGEKEKKKAAILRG